MKNIKDFNVQKHISRPHVIFTPAVNVGADRRRTPLLLNGLKMQEALIFKGSAKKKAGKKDGGSGTLGGSEHAGPVVES